MSDKRITLDPLVEVLTSRNIVMGRRPSYARERAEREASAIRRALATEGDAVAPSEPAR